MLAILTSRTVQGCLTPDQVLEHLRAAFDEVRVDVGEGRSRAEAELAVLRRLNAPREIIEMSERGVAHTRWVVVTEGSSSFAFMLSPEANIRIQHDDHLDALIRRCAEVLDCDLEVCG